MTEEEEYEEEEENQMEKNKNKEISNKGKIQENNIADNNEDDNNFEENNNINITNQQKTTNQNKIEENNENEKISKEREKKFILSFNKKLKEIEQLSDKFDSFFNRHINKINLSLIKKKEEKKTYYSQDKKLLEKDLQIKNDLSMIHNLTKENKKLKEKIDSLNKMLYSNQEISSIDKMILKNEEIEKLKMKNIELNKKYEEANSYKLSYAKKIERLESIINKQKKKIFELSLVKDNKMSQSVDNRNNLKIHKVNQTNKLLLKSSSEKKMIKKDKKMKTISFHNYFNNNLYQLLNEKEINALKKLFGSKEDFNNFNEKLIKLETRNKSTETLFENNIKKLNKVILNKENEIETLNKEKGQKDLKIKTLENNINELKVKNKMLDNKQKKILSIEKQLKECGFKTEKMTYEDKLEKIKESMNHYKKVLNKKYIEKRKDEEINKINAELGNIQFISSGFFKNFKKSKNIDSVSNSTDHNE